MRGGGEAEALGGDVASLLPLVAVGVVHLHILQGHRVPVRALALAADDMQRAVHGGHGLVAPSGGHGLAHHPLRGARPHVKALDGLQGRLEVVAVVEAADGEGAVAHHQRREVAAPLLHLRAHRPCRQPRLRGVEDVGRRLRGPLRVVAPDDVDLAAVREGRVVRCRVEERLRESAPSAGGGVEDVHVLHDGLRAVGAAEEVDLAAYLRCRVAVAGTRRVGKVRTVLVSRREVRRRLAGDRGW
mmetsp:Transcript_34463/g.80009  ORF Transcript_34463/g.80009 Transcript_34463/m.80009 type:complete len:243 (-) Transcript_34463:319-1047(-)